MDEEMIEAIDEEIGEMRAHALAVAVSLDDEAEMNPEVVKRVLRDLAFDVLEGTKRIRSLLYGE